MPGLSMIITCHLLCLCSDVFLGQDPGHILGNASACSGCIVCMSGLKLGRSRLAGPVSCGSHGLWQDCQLGKTCYLLPVLCL